MDQWSGSGRSDGVDLKIVMGRAGPGRAVPWPMERGLYMGHSTLLMRPPTMFDGPARAAAHNMYVVYHGCYYFDVRPAHNAALVLLLAHSGRGPWHAVYRS